VASEPPRALVADDEIDRARTGGDPKGGVGEVQCDAAGHDPATAMAQSHSALTVPVRR
jgi:hypothetical protein